MIAGTTEIKNVIKEYYEQLYAIKLDKLDSMEIFLKRLLQKKFF